MINMQVLRRERLHSTGVLMLATICAALTTVQCGKSSEQGQIFESPEEATKALVTAAKANDTDGLLRILGTKSKDLIVTSDPVSDRNEKKRFSDRADEKTDLQPVEGDSNRKILVVGSDQWPFPFPLVQVDGKWQFNANDGADELLLRRIGDNELTALDVCRGFFEAQYDYAGLNARDAKVTEFAQKFISTPGKRDGLYWKSDDPNDQSPVAEVVAKAQAEGYTNKSDPYRGYYFKVLTGQGAQAPGGAMSYMDNGALKKGFALIAWPADYGSTGIMTFFINQSGIAFQKDLGEKTGMIASAVTEYNPDGSWTVVPASNIPGEY